MYDDHLLPPGARLLHIGPPKTGTTFLQSALAQLRDEVAQHGVLYPGEGWRSKTAVREAVGRPARGLTARVDARRAEQAAAEDATDGDDGDDGDGSADPFSWAELAAEVRAAGDVRVCVSNETFAVADDEQAARTVRDLGDEDVHVVMVARPLGRLLPSQWQQRVRKQQGMVSFDDWLRIVLHGSEEEAHHRHFWHQHDLDGMIRRWSAAAPGRVSVIVSREGDRSYLPRLFEGMLGLPEGMLDRATPQANFSLSLSEAELVRSLDEVAERRGWDPEFYYGGLKRQVLRFIRRHKRGPDDRPLVLPAWVTERVAELDAERQAVLESSGVRVIGDPASLCEPARTIPDDEAARPVLIPADLAARLTGFAVHRVLSDVPAETEPPAAPVRTALEQASTLDLAAALARRARRGRR
ncbi:hypothetical protein [Nocardioides donggukensis]|uniref:Sulfotransferase family protein n=1 Tax=Nocardioides donggukensis TaxID=2774019 RepID=A0A927Q1D5_9ACTN|nr:hypothetical protein [Nocardioides donggukensis]MBD8869354.1 hypothetical protein [Nocardioides donggukensis]